MTMLVTVPELSLWAEGDRAAISPGAKVTHKGKTLTSTAAANIWEPGVYGWV